MYYNSDGIIIGFHEDMINSGVVYVGPANAYSFCCRDTQPEPIMDLSHEPENWVEDVWYNERDEAEPLHRLNVSSTNIRKTLSITTSTIWQIVSEGSVPRVSPRVSRMSCP